MRGGGDSKLGNSTELKISAGISRKINFPSVSDSFSNKPPDLDSL